MKPEYWKEIPGYRMPYRVSRGGEVQRLEDGVWVDVHGIDGRNSIMVNLLKKEKGRDRKAIARLVAEYFMGGCPPGAVVVHVDGNRNNNSVGNLRIMSNMQIGKTYGYRGRRKPVVKEDSEGNVVDFYASASEAARANYFDTSLMRRRCRGAAGQTDGYFYYYENSRRRKSAIQKTE